MIIKKIIAGYVEQRFDTETGAFVSQNFYPDEDAFFKDEFGDRISYEEAMKLTKHKVLSCEMRQP